VPVVGFDTPLKAVVGDKTAIKLADELAIYTVGALVRHYPRRYAQRGQLVWLDDVVEGEHVTVMGKVHANSTRTFQKRTPGKSPNGTLREVTIDDGKGRLRLTFFGNGGFARGGDLQIGRVGLFSGKVSTFNGKRQLNQPEYLLVDPMDDPEDWANKIIPIYPATAGIQSWTIAKAVGVVLDVLDVPEDPLPAALRARLGLAPLADSLEQLHRPTSLDALDAARDRMRWDEAFVLQVALAQRRIGMWRTPATARPPVPGGLADAFDARLPFSLTSGQQAVAAELARDLARDVPMHRLLQGEVGSGKTVVAVRAMLTVADSGGQSALLAPTEVLAAQHYRAITALLGPLGEKGRLGGADVSTRVVLLTGSQTAAQRREALLAAASGEAGIVVGTHALIQDAVQFAELGLVVVDEQHRFGVHQRDALRAKGGAAVAPHLLVMTATPIPRTVAMTVFGDLDVSELRELPSGRAPIQSFVVPREQPKFAPRMWQRVRDEVAAGRQAYVVCARIGDKDSDEDANEGDEGRTPGAAVVDVLPLLAEGELSGLRVAALHGRMTGDEKDRVMRLFAAGELDVLVATTVIEVGVDVPNATVMVVLDADRFGISQLHQLRGRVGRGSAQGFCFLQTDLPPASPARERLDAVARTLDGFELARIDLELRREGDVLGASQSGRTSLHFLRLTTDADVIAQARTEATAIVEFDPVLADHPAIARAVAISLDDERADYLERA
jgi:ATP-dependent DNA helicase RecG